MQPNQRERLLWQYCQEEMETIREHVWEVEEKEQVYIGFSAV